MGDQTQLTWVLVGIFLVTLWILLKYLKKQRRLNYLTQKYDSAGIAKKIVAKKVWREMTSEMLTDSWGTPEDVDQTVYKEKTKEVWKYGNTGKNRYRQRVTLENGLVVGWQQQ